MRVQTSMVWVIGLSSLVYAGGASAVTAPLDADESLTGIAAEKIGIRTVRPAAQESYSEDLNGLAANGEATVKVDTITGAPRLISGAPLMFGTATTVADFIAAAQGYVAEHSATLGFTPADMKLNDKATLVAKDIQLVSFKILRDGLEVQDSNVDFRFKNGQLVQVANKSYSEAKVAKASLKADLQASVEKALAPKSVAKNREVYRVVPAAKGYQLVRVAEFNTLTQKNKLYVVEVDAATGELFEVRPTEFNFSGAAKGEVYQRTYYQEQPVVLPYRDLTLTYQGGTVTTDADGKFTGAPDGAQPSINGFSGTRINVAPNSGDPVVLNGNHDAGGWLVAFKRNPSEDVSADKAMAQSMTYYHLNKEIQHAKAWINPTWFDQQMTANVNLEETCNAYWDGSTVNLFSAGDGCANTALISDVFYHEWGHGLHANTSGIEDRAYSEGFADTCALLMTHSNLVGPGFRLANGAPVRDLTTLKTYPEDSNIEIHQEGLIVGGSFWDLYQSLIKTYGQDKADSMLSNYVLKVIYTTHAYTDVYDALLTIDSQTGNLAAGSPNLCAINAAFTHHGLAKADSRCGNG